MVYLFCAEPRFNAQQQLVPLPAGAIQSFVLNVPRTWSTQDVIRYAIQNNLGTPKQVKYKVVPVEYNDDALLLLCTQISLGGQGVNAAPAVLSPAHVNGGQPTGAPIGQPMQNRPEGMIDKSGFQELGDAALAASQDNVFGGADDGTVTDLIMGGFGSVEVQR
jgi:hypothetical protein